MNVMKSINVKLMVQDKWKYIYDTCPCCRKTCNTQCAIILNENIGYIWLCNECAINSGLLNNEQKKLLMEDLIKKAFEEQET